MFVKVNGTNFVRDTDTMALINKDVNGLQEYNMKRRMAQVQREEINNVKSEVAEIREDMSEIKALLLKLIGKDTNG
jgi:hypothetical protein